MTRYADRVKELKRGGSSSAHLSKEDKLAKQLMLPRMGKNSKQILVQKKKVGGPVFQKYDVKRGVTDIEQKEEVHKKLTPVKPVTPKGMIREKKGSRNDMMKGMFYSKKDLLSKVKPGDYKVGSRRERVQDQGGESREEMMYRILKSKGKGKDKGKGIRHTRDGQSMEQEEPEYPEEQEYPEERRDFDVYKNKFYRQKEKMHEMPVQKEPMNVRMVRKSNSMLPSSGMFLGPDPVANPDLNSNPNAKFLKQQFLKNHRKNPSNVYQTQESNQLTSARPGSSEKKSSSTKPNKQLPEDPFKDFLEREKKYDKDILRDMLELEDMFTQDYSRHIDAMVGLVKRDIAMQAGIREEKGPMRFEESISKVKSILTAKRDSLDLMVAAIRRFEDKFARLRQRKEQMKRAMLPSKIKYTNPSRNMQGGLPSNGGSMYGGGMNPKMNPSLKPLNLNPQKPRKFQYQGFGRPDLDPKPKGMMMMKPVSVQEKFGNMSGSKKELRPIPKDVGKQKFSMLPQRSIAPRKDENKEATGARARTDTEVTRDLMNDLDLDNDLSLI